MSIYTNRILKYLEGEMSSGERDAFREELKRNADMLKEFRLMMIAEDLLAGEARLEEMMSDPGMQEVEEDAKMIADAWIAQQEKKEKEVKEKEGQKAAQDGDPKEGQTGGREEEPKRKKKNNSNVFLIPTLIGLAAAAVILFFLVINTFVLAPRAERFFQSYSQEIDPSELALPEMPPDLYERFKQGIDYYNSGDFDMAVKTFESLEDYGDQYPEILLYLGISEMKKGETRNALENFKKIQTIDGPHVEYASFYSGLCYVRLGKPSVALLYLTESTGLSKHLDPSTQKLLRRVNLINTFQFKQLKKEMSQDMPTDKAIGPVQATILFTTVFLLTLLWLLPSLDIISRNYNRKKTNLWLFIVIFFTFIGPIIYLIFGRKKR